jgi:hypothetical protein
MSTLMIIAIGLGMKTAVLSTERFDSMKQCMDMRAAIVRRYEEKVCPSKSMWCPTPDIEERDIECIEAP